MSDHANNFLAAEPHIVQRLQDALAADPLPGPAVKVLTAADLAGVKEQAQLVPAVHVIWSGFRVMDGRADGVASKLRHTWIISAAVRNLHGGRGGSAARQEAGELLARAGAALMGFRPPGVAGPMVLAPETPPAHFSGGFMYLPLAFHLPSIFQAS